MVQYVTNEESIAAGDTFALTLAIITKLETRSTTTFQASGIVDFVRISSAAHNPPLPVDIFTVRAGASDGIFNYAGGSFNSGENPLDSIGSLLFIDSALTHFVSITGFTLSYSQLVSLQTVAQVEALLFGGSDQILTKSSNNVIHALGGDDSVFSGAGNDTVYGGTGKDSLNGEAGNDKLYGQDGIDSLFGGAGNDTEDGGSGNDTVLGGDGNDTLLGGTGDDKLVGGFGKDTLTGGGGKDKFAYQTLSKFNGKESGLTAATRDTITDFQHSIDKIDVGFILIPTFKFLGTAALTGLGQIHYKYAGTDTIVEVSTDTDAAAELAILLKGHISLSASDFVL